MRAMDPRIRLATVEDAEAVQAIYAPIVRDTRLSFELEPPSVEEMRRRIETTLSRLPWLVYDDNRGVVGFAYAAPFRSRPAYQWTVEVSVYVHEQHRRRGIARALYMSLLDRLREQGFRMALAVIGLPNPPSVKLHEGLGFKPVGVFHHSGYKLGEWRDTGWWELSLQDLPDPPQSPRGIIQS